MILINERAAAQLREMGYDWPEDAVTVSPPLPLTPLEAEIADYRANVLPKRMQEAASEVNARLGHLLPDGLRFEWGTGSQSARRLELTRD